MKNILIIFALTLFSLPALAADIPSPEVDPILIFQAPTLDDTDSSDVLACSFFGGCGCNCGIVDHYGPDVEAPAVETDETEDPVAIFFWRDGSDKFGPVAWWSTNGFLWDTRDE